MSNLQSLFACLIILIGCSGKDIPGYPTGEYDSGVLDTVQSETSEQLFGCTVSSECLGISECINGYCRTPCQTPRDCQRVDIIFNSCEADSAGIPRYCSRR